MEKTKYELKAEAQSALASPKTLQAHTEMMPVQGVQIPLYAVYGRSADDAKVWCATFFDIEEAQAWIQASKMFGRAVRGAVIADQKLEASNDAEKADQPA